MNLEPFTYSKKWIGITFFRLPLTVADIYLHYSIFYHYHSTIILNWQNTVLHSTKALSSFSENKQIIP
ncbi:hypothetical protein PARMER_02759 [Parabacteroides merdae ATCC 43184]|jgi:hypothetical protein|nr:hypothetical protein PARMER_02759 [Parabacteroides merdae ATCC 43184]